MNIQVTIDGTDRSANINWDSVIIADAIDNKVDTASFSITRSVGDSVYTPSTNDEVVITDTDTATILFAGKITNIDITKDSQSILVYDVDCSDYLATSLTDKLIVDRFSNTTLRSIVQSIISKNTTGFTALDANVGGDSVVVDIVTFNRVTVKKALESLANKYNYHFYVDSSKNLHFFAKYSKSAPFSITDTSENYINDSLSINIDFSQIKNVVIVKGGKTEGDERTEYISGTGTDSKAFPLAYEYSAKPVIKLSGVTQSVGIDGSDDSADFDVLWSASNQSITFTDVPPSGTENISVTGKPLLQLVVNVPDGTSIVEYGRQEFLINDDRLTTRDDAINFAKAELEAYKDPQYSIKFKTYTSGLRSGQTINLNSSIFNINDDFLVNKVKFNLINQDNGFWQVDLVSHRDVTLVDILQQLIQGENVESTDAETLYELIQLFTQATASTGDINIPSRTSQPPYYYADATGGHEEGKWNFATWG